MQTYCVYNLYFTKLKSRVNLYRNARGKRTVGERLKSDDLISEYYVTITQPTVSKKRFFSRGFIYSRTPVTRTRKANEKQFELLQLDCLPV